MDSRRWRRSRRKETIIIEINKKSKKDFQVNFKGISMLPLWIFCRSLRPASQNPLCISLPNLTRNNKTLINLINLSESMLTVKIRNEMWIHKTLKKKWMFRNKNKLHKACHMIKPKYRIFTQTMKWMIRKTDKDPNLNRKK